MMERFCDSEQAKNLDRELTEFRTEIQGLKDKEISGERRETHFVGVDSELDCDVGKLDANDMTIWKKYKSGELNEKEFGLYRGTMERKNFKDSLCLARFVADQIGDWNVYKELSEFRKEIAGVKDGEAAGEIKSHHFHSIDHNELKGLDMKDLIIWNKFKQGILEEKEFNEYRNRTIKECGADPTKKASFFFAMYIANRVLTWGRYKEEHRG